MKNFKKRAISLLLALALAIPVISIPVKSEAASKKPYLDKEVTYIETSKTLDRIHRYISLQNVSPSSKYTNVKSSNPSVVKASVVTQKIGTQKHNYVEIVAKSFGTSTISFKYKGKKYSQKVTI